MSPSALLPSQLPASSFVQRYGGVYEHSQWVAEAIAKEGITAADDEPAHLSARMGAIVDGVSEAAKLELLRLHPELAGKLKVGEALTESSRAEQSGARLDQCSPDEFARFQALNEAYRSRFGFPFIIAVTGLSRGDILAAFERRVSNSREAEFATALKEVHKIARIRIEGLVKSAS